MFVHTRGYAVRATLSLAMLLPMLTLPDVTHANPGVHSTAAATNQVGQGAPSPSGTATGPGLAPGTYDAGGPGRDRASGWRPIRSGQPVDQSAVQQLTNLAPAKIWVGLKNSDDVGTKFDLLAEVYHDNSLVTSGHLDNVPGGSSGFNNAQLRTIAFDSFAPVDFPAGSQLTIKLYVRNACIGPTHNSGTARLWYNDPAANSRFGATIGQASTDSYLLNNFVLGATAGPGPKRIIDVAAGTPCSAFKPLGTWASQTTPGPPQSVTATGQNRQAAVSWSAPLNGGSPITSYTITASPGGATATSTSTSVTFTGLQIATTYTFTVTATNAVGTGPASAPSNAATTWDNPGAPQSVTATAGNAQATVSWQAPSSDGGSPITGYTVTPYTGTTAQPATNVGGSTLSATINGLTNATAYTFAVTATSVVGAGPAGTSPPVTPATVPGPPRNVNAVAGNAQAAVLWQAPSSDGGTPITGYTVTPYIGTTAQPATSVNASTLSTTFTGLTNGTSYTFAVTATTAVGTGPTGTSPPVTPATVPGPPQNGSAVAGNERATVSWQPPSANGGSPITGYLVTTFIGTTQQAVTTANAETLSTTITGLTNGTTYTFTVAATNAAGTGSPSSMSAAPSNLPSAPLNVSATAGGSDRVTVSWQTPAYDGDNPITGYVVTPYQGATALTPVNAAASPLTVTGLNGNTSYTFSVAATNANGTGTSATSSTVTTTITPCPVPGATNVWTGAAGTTSWTTAGNWSAGHQPFPTDAVCLPAGTPGSSSISVPSTTVKQLISYKQLSIVGGFTTTNGADFEASATWTGGTFAGPSLTIGSAATITINGQVTLAGSIAVTNAGAVQIVNGTYPIGVQSCGAGNTASWTNTGTLVFADPGAASLRLCAGSFTNDAGGMVNKTGGGTDFLSAAQLTSTGAIRSQAGVLVVGSGSLTGGRVGGGPGQVVLSGTVTVNASVAVDDNVWVVGTLSGASVVSAGATLHVGYDPSYSPSQLPTAGTISDVVTGAGRLSVTGHVFDNFPNGTFVTTAVLAADLDIATVTLGDYTTLAVKPDATSTVIGSGTSVDIAGRVTLAGSVAVTSSGTVDVTVGVHTMPNGSVFGGISSPCGVADTPSWVNAGTLTFSDSGSGAASVSLCTGSFTNSGTVGHTGPARDFVSAAQLTNTGAVTSQAGILVWSSATGLFAGGTVAGTTGQININGTTTATAAATVGDNVWVVSSSTLTGTIVIPFGATVHVGYNAANPTNINGVVGTVSGTVTGEGTLNATGHVFDNFPNGTNIATAVIAADLDIANVTLGDYTTLAVKPDATPTVIGSNAVVTMPTTPTLASGLTLHNHGTIDFGTNNYFNCSTCTVTNEPGAALLVRNPDGSFTHGFGINSGTFDNEGIIRLTGYLPGAWVWFGPNVTLVGAKSGLAEFAGLLQPTWIQNLHNGAVQWANALTQPGLTGLGTNAIMYAAAYLGNVGVGKCKNVNVSIGVAGGSTGVCVVVDPTGAEAVVLTVSGGLSGGVQWPGNSQWNVAQLLTAEPSFSIDLGAEALWTIDPTGGQGFAISDLDGPAWCQNGTLVSPGLVGVTGQHCWGPKDHVPFQLNTPSVTQPGVHSGYVGGVVGTPSIATGVMLSYSVTIGCAQWYSLTQQVCPPTNITPPSISGTPAVGQTLNVTNGTWTMSGANDPALTYRYQWLRCTTSSTTSCSSINGATSNTYTVTAADKNYWITASVAASNSGGSSQIALAAPVGGVP